MNIDQYQEFTKTTAVYPKEQALSYVTLGLAGEAGEVANKVKKIIRDNNGVITDQTRKDIASELGDVYWYLARLADELNIKSSEVIISNTTKLTARLVNNTIKGSGDNR
ncbi:MAG: nucleoside triphosphate pyrophosphohydrolase family protein [Candidatus Woesearchaeota archaeon]|jgi:NTP pyrophosphatase (non-canonical NTP hydrolase)